MKGKWFLIPGAIAVAALVILILRMTAFLPETDPAQEDKPSTTTTASTTATAPTTTTTTAPAEDVVTPGHLSFTGKVLEVDGEMALMENYDKDKFDTVWVTVSQTGVAPKVGEEYTVTYEDMMMPSLPPRITAVQMELVSSTPAQPTFISEERAIEIAAKYWNIQPGDRDPDTGFMMSIHVMESPTQENAKYRMALRWLVEVNGEPANYSTLDTINVDAVTGEILPPSEFGVTQ